MLPDRRGIIEHTFESVWACRPTPESAALIDQICATARAENRAAAAQLVAIGELFGYRFSRCADNEEWAIDTVVAVAAEVGAALRISQGQGLIRVHLARALRERLPMVGVVFAAGEIDYRAFQTIVSRTDLVLDPDVLAAVDAALALEVPRWPSLSHGRLGAEVDKVVGRLDADAVRRRSERTRDREIWIGTNKDGLSEINGSLCTPAAHALDTRLTALAGTVCEHDPRTRDQRRADALGALAAGADRLGCRCGRDDCAAGKRPSAGPVTIHVIAEQPTIDGTGCAPGCEVGADGLITAEMVAELAKSAKLMPLQHPGDSAPEPGHVPSRMLASFVRCRDLTCRWPGCDTPAVACDVDHTIPNSQGRPAHAANLKCYCRPHHLLKTFWGWREQMPDGTLILTSPAGHTYVTTPGSALLFPSLCRSVGGPAAPEAESPPEDCGERTAMMPRRRRTRARARARAQRIATERRANHAARFSDAGPAPPSVDDGSAPF
ncbi:HNH endonuclease signature motif containing protein [Mycobacterium shigaense]|uniref:Uncharacterized protein n=1 Tax=Mycobacterium shigaense TaxID=722731 RepID=A0A1Z4EPC3_9MYCO|nr:hypothetical protein B2J96_11135 [Mycobacterium shigaense]BAX94829.1 hypothetical protein MSG_04717 [Mycobacterium shigaense]